MGSIQRYGLNNNLIRWVHRHHRMATLFRSALPVDTPRLSAPRRLTFVRSPSPALTPVPEPAPESHLPKQTIQRQVELTPPPPASSTRVPPARNEMPSIKSQIPESTEIPEASEQKDKEWRRLQTIMRKHEAKETISSSVQETAPVTTHATLEPGVRGLKKEAPKIQRSEVQESETPSPEPMKPTEELQKRTFQGPSAERVQLKPHEQPEPQQSSLHKASVQAKELNLPQRALQGLRSIFRKREEQNTPSSEGMPRSTESVIERTDSEGPQTISDLHVVARSAETIQAGEPSLPVQRFVEKPGAQKESSEENTPRRTQSSLSSPARPMIDVNAETDEIGSDHEPSDQIVETPYETSPAKEMPPLPPLESVWHVQRVETPQPISSNVISHEGPELPTNPDPMDEGKEYISSTFDEDQQPLIDELPAPRPSAFDSPNPSMEILTPSRPRPSQTKLKPRETHIQRQPEEKESTLVNTAIGPLPSDLWSLLGEKPPAAAFQQARKAETSGGAETYPDQKVFPRPEPSPREEMTTEAPALVQRQPVSNVSPAAATPEPAESSAKKETSGDKTKLDDLAERVYSQIRQRLNLERERMRGK